MVCIAGETLHVFFLGTAGALPTTNKNPSCIMVRRGSDMILFDCGEGAQQQMMRARTGFTVDAIFITHWHADHFLGVFGLVQTMSFMGREDPLTVYGPSGVEEFVHMVQHTGSCNLKFPIRSVVLSDGDVLEFDGYRISAFSTYHCIESFGYMLVEDDRPGRFDREKAIELGIPPGPLFGRLQRGEPVRIERDGGSAEIRPDQVMGAPRPGRKIVYTGDTRPVPQRIEPEGKDADLLIHDATFDDAAIDRAREVFHSTAGEAGEAATYLNARMLALVHISSRYPMAANHITDAAKKYSGRLFAPDDLDIVEIRFRS